MPFPAGDLWLPALIAAVLLGFFAAMWLISRNYLKVSPNAVAVLSGRKRKLPDGRVVIALPVGGVGQVRCKIGEELVDKIARSTDTAPIAENTPVVIEEVVGETVVVRRR